MKMNREKLGKASSDDKDIFDESDSDCIVSKTSCFWLCRPFIKIKIITISMKT